MIGHAEPPALEESGRCSCGFHHDLSRIHRARPGHAHRDLPPARQSGLGLGRGGAGSHDPAARPDPEAGTGAQLSLPLGDPGSLPARFLGGVFPLPGGAHEQPQPGDAPRHSYPAGRALRHLEPGRPAGGAAPYRRIHRSSGPERRRHPRRFSRSRPTATRRCARHCCCAGLGERGRIRRCYASGPHPTMSPSEPLLRDETLPAMRLTDIGVYRSFGDEIL